MLRVWASRLSAISYTRFGRKAFKRNSNKYDCSGCFRLERLPLHPLESAAFSWRTRQAAIADRDGGRRSRA